MTIIKRRNFSKSAAILMPLHTPLARATDPADIERHSFSQRLQEALRAAEYAPDSPTQLAREFNLRYEGRPVTVHAARKWLMGEAIPTQGKLRALALWLGVSAEWLRFGGSKSDHDLVGEKQGGRIKQKHLMLIEDLERLDDKHQEIVVSLVRQLIHANSKK
jgi:transcriptional regulator with XRE-family HTH domain